jgi:ribosome recycling factor
VGRVSDEERKQIMEAAWKKGGLEFRAAFRDTLIDEKANKIVADFIREKICEIVKNPATAKLLGDIDHPFAAKRPPVDSQYFETYNLDHVDLVNIREAPIEKIIATGSEKTALVVKPHDRGALGAIEKAIRESDLGLNPSNDGVIIRLSIPVLTEERRKEYVKIVKNMTEDGRIAVRNIRRDARKQMETAEKNSDISKDELERAEKELDKLTQDHIELIEKAFARKEHELLEV